MKDKILMISEVHQPICDVLADDYDFIYAGSVSDGLDMMYSRLGEYVAVIADVSLAAAEDFRLLRIADDDLKFIYTPLIVVADRAGEESALACLEHGALELFAPPFIRKLVLNRLKNAIYIRNSITYEEMDRILKNLPSNIYLKDSEGKYIFCTHYWHHLEHGDDPDWTIRGKTDVDIRKDKENAMEAMQKDIELMETGKGTSYVIEINADGIQEFFEIIKEPVRSKNGKVRGIIGLINNVTEHERMKRQFRSASMTDGLTGLFNRAEIQSIIASHLARKEQFALVMTDIDNFKSVNDTYGHNNGDIVIISLADVLRFAGERYGAECFAGRWGGEEFMLLVHGVDVAAAETIAEGIRQQFAGIAVSEEVPPQTISVGVTQVIESDTVDSLCSRVDSALYMAKKTGKNKVVRI